MYTCTTTRTPTFGCGFVKLGSSTPRPRDGESRIGSLELVIKMLWKICKKRCEHCKFLWNCQDNIDCTVSNCPTVPGWNIGGTGWARWTSPSISIAESHRAPQATIGHQGPVFPSFSASRSWRPANDLKRASTWISSNHLKSLES